MNIDCDWCICGKRALSGKLYCSYECQIKDAVSVASSSTATPSASSSLSSSSASSFISSSTIVNNSTIPLNYNATNAYNVYNYNLPRHNIPPQAWDPFRRRYSLPAVLHQNHNKNNNLSQLTPLSNYKNTTINNTFGNGNNNTNINTKTFFNNNVNNNNNTAYPYKNIHRLLNRSNSCYAFYNRNNTSIINQPPVIHTTTTTSHYSINKNNNINGPSIITNNNNNPYISLNIYQQQHCYSHYDSSSKRNSEDSTKNNNITEINNDSDINEDHNQKEPMIVINLMNNTKCDPTNINDNTHQCKEYHDKGMKNELKVNKFPNKSHSCDFIEKRTEKIEQESTIKEKEKNNPALLGSYLKANTIISNSLITNALSMRSSFTANSTIDTTATNVIASTTNTSSLMNYHFLSTDCDNNNNLKLKGVVDKSKDTSLEKLLKKSNLLNKEYKSKEKNSDLYNKFISFSYKKFFIRKNIDSNLHSDENSFDSESSLSDHHQKIEKQINGNNNGKSIRHKEDKKKPSYGLFSRKVSSPCTIDQSTNETSPPPQNSNKRKESNPKNIIYKNKRNALNNQRPVNSTDCQLNGFNNSYVDDQNYFVNANHNDNNNSSEVDHSFLIDDDSLINDDQDVLKNSGKNYEYDIMTTFPMDNTLMSDHECEKDHDSNCQQLPSINVCSMNSNDHLIFQEPLSDNSSLTSLSYKGNNFSFDEFIERNKEDNMYLINKNFRFGYNDDDQFCLNDYYYDGNVDALNKNQFYKKGSELDRILNYNNNNNNDNNNNDNNNNNNENNNNNNNEDDEDEDDENQNNLTEFERKKKQLILENWILLWLLILNTCFIIVKNLEQLTFHPMSQE